MDWNAITRSHGRCRIPVNWLFWAWNLWAMPRPWALSCRIMVFKNGKPSKKDYRNFNIKTVEGPDDFASMEEVVFRRYKRLLDEGATITSINCY